MDDLPEFNEPDGNGNDLPNGDLLPDSVGSSHSSLNDIAVTASLGISNSAGGNSINSESPAVKNVNIGSPRNSPGGTVSTSGTPTPATPMLNPRSVPDNKPMQHHQAPSPRTTGMPSMNQLSTSVNMNARNSIQTSLHNGNPNLSGPPMSMSSVGENFMNSPMTMSNQNASMPNMPQISSSQGFASTPNMQMMPGGNAVRMANASMFGNVNNVSAALKMQSLQNSVGRQMGNPVQQQQQQLMDSVGGNMGLPGDMMGTFGRMNANAMALSRVS